ncbi:MAG TPA: tetratricopeptide repeat protein [Thermoanaerobaculia bacterium]|nr:tetratricopeptide repeat protein [Thermoanaerobaculia bacterium]
MYRAPLRLPLLFVLIASLLVAGLSAAPAAARDSAGGAQLTFGVKMAQQGLWNEALFRFHQAELADPANPRIRNNLAVAYEATGDFEKALTYYKQALEASPNDRTLRGNYARFVEFYQAFKGGKAAKSSAAKDGIKSTLNPAEPLVPTGAPASSPRPPIEIPATAPPPIDIPETIPPPPPI